MIAAGAKLSLVADESPDNSSPKSRLGRSARFGMRAGLEGARFAGAKAGGVVRSKDRRKERMDDVALWPFADFLWGREQDVISSVLKLRQHGFHDTIDSEGQILRYLRRYREERILP